MSQQKVVPGRSSIAAGSADFLDVVLESFGHVVVDDAADVRLVDAHPEGHSGDDDANFSGHELKERNKGQCNNNSKFALTQGSRLEGLCLKDNLLAWVS